MLSPEERTDVLRHFHAIALVLAKQDMRTQRYWRIDLGGLVFQFQSTGFGAAVMRSEEEVEGEMSAYVNGGRG